MPAHPNRKTSEKPMRAAFIQKHGPLDVLQYGHGLPMPMPGLGEVRIRICAAALNRLDLWVREGWPGLNLPMPHILGADGAGVIDALGADVQSLMVGQRVVINPGIAPANHDARYDGQENMAPGFSVLGEHQSGTYAEYVCVPARNVLPLPDYIPFEEAAAAALVYVTAWHSLISRGRLQAGQRVLIIGAGGGVNSASIQIAKLAGAEVYVVGNGAAKIAQAKQLGADEVIDRSQEDWSRAVHRLTNKQGVDVVVDNVGQETLFGSIRALRPGGRILIVGNTSGPIIQVDLRYIFTKQIEIIGSTMGPYRDFAAVMGLVFAGKLKPIIGARLPLAEAAKAQKMLAENAVFGKIILEIAD
jgi:NADPH:quinone reductase-like Zn-dependent oxidoreductase